MLPVTRNLLLHDTVQLWSDCDIIWRRWAEASRNPDMTFHYQPPWQCKNFGRKGPIFMFLSSSIFKQMAALAVANIVARIVDTQFTLLIIHSSSQRLAAHNTRLTIRLGAFMQGAFKGEVKQCFYWKMNLRCKGLEKPLRKGHLRVISPACPSKNTTINTDQVVTAGRWRK